MSDSLAGGLLPLGKYSASGSVEGSSLSGGLIPLGGSSKSGKATAVGGFGRLGLDQPSHDDEASTWDKDKNGRKDRRASGLKTERESKVGAQYWSTQIVSFILDRAIVRTV